VHSTGGRTRIVFTKVKSQVNNVRSLLQLDDVNEAAAALSKQEVDFGPRLAQLALIKQTSETNRKIVGVMTVAMVGLQVVNRLAARHIEWEQDVLTTAQQLKLGEPAAKRNGTPRKAEPPVRAA
jgi:hypothetical protein